MYRETIPQARRFHARDSMSRIWDNGVIEWIICMLIARILALRAKGNPLKGGLQYPIISVILSKLCYQYLSIYRGLEERLPRKAHNLENRVRLPDPQQHFG